MVYKILDFCQKSVIINYNGENLNTINEENNWPTWTTKDFVFDVIDPTAWADYLKDYPNLQWGTCVVKSSDEKFLVRRFISKNKCFEYCTSPTVCDIREVL